MKKNIQATEDWPTCWKGVNGSRHIQAIRWWLIMVWVKIVAVCDCGISANVRHGKSNLPWLLKIQSWKLRGVARLRFLPDRWETWSSIRNQKRSDCPNTNDEHIMALAAIGKEESRWPGLGRMCLLNMYFHVRCPYGWVSLPWKTGFGAVSFLLPVQTSTCWCSLVEGLLERRNPCALMFLLATFRCWNVPLETVRRKDFSLDFLFEALLWWWVTKNHGRGEPF